VRRAKSQSYWFVTKSAAWWGLLVGAIFQEIFFIILCQNLNSNDTHVPPILLLTPFLLGLFFWLLPVGLYAGQYMEPLSLAVDYFEPSQADPEELIYRQPLLGQSLNYDDSEDGLIN
jgi:hypothetical protein